MVSVSKEEQLVERTGKFIPSKSGRSRSSRLILGIGDDAAIVGPRRGTEWVLTCDQFLEGVHFLADVHPPDSVGYKALARATSDIAAMGATPRLFLLAMALPESRTGRWLDGFLRGMGRAARELGLTVAGGDTSKSRNVTINLSVLGEINTGRALRRSGARPGDIIYVSGRLGAAQLGLELVRAGLGRQARFRGLIQQHLYPRIRVKLAVWLAKHRTPSAMMDISDGLSTDLGRLCNASGVGARIWEDRIPAVGIPTALATGWRGRPINRIQMALQGGDDYGLLFTVAPRNVNRLSRAPEFRDLTAIGEIVRARRIDLVGNDGGARVLRAGGWDPFRNPQ
jgi:thiamine-monophosphate kinase